MLLMENGKSVMVPDEFTEFCYVCQKQRKFETKEIIAYSKSLNFIIVDGICKVCKRCKKLKFFQKRI